MKHLVRLALALSFLALPAMGHSFYDAQCCNDNDCHPIPDEAVTVTDKGYHVKYWGKAGYPVERFVLLSQAKMSPDGRYHGCDIGMSLICLYVPPPAI